MKHTPDPLRASQPAARQGRTFLLTALLGLLPVALPLIAGCSNNLYPPDEALRPILYRSLSDDPKTLDPSVAYTVDALQIISVIYNGYFEYDYLKQNPLTLDLGIGAVMPTRSAAPAWLMENGKKVWKTGELWSFRLKPGLRYQDDPCFPGGKGREIVAADIIYSFKRMADPKVPCPVLAYFLDKLVGLQEYNDYQRGREKKGLPADYSYPVEGLQLDPHDKYAFRILLNQPYPQLRYLMAMNFTAPIPWEAEKKYGPEFRRHPVGCGPFVLAEWTPKLRIVLKKNPNFRPEYYPSQGDPGDRKAGLLADAGKRLPLVDEVVYTILKEDITGWNLFLQGYMDAWGVPQESFTQVVSRQGTLTPRMKAHGIKLDRTRAPNIEYFAFNMSDPTVGGYSLKQRRLRQAISMAIDTQSELDLFNSGMGKIAQFLIPPGLFGYEKSFRNPYRRFDLTAAKRLLAEAGYPKGIDSRTGNRLTITFDNAATTPAGRQFVIFLIQQFARIGIRLVSRTSTPEVWQDRVDHGQFQFIHYGWLADYPDPENFVFLLYGPNRRPGPNSAAYNDPEYNRLFEQMRSMDDAPQRMAIIRKTRTIALEDCPWVFDYHSEDLVLHYNWVQNEKQHPVALDSAKYVAIDPVKRSELRQAWNRPNYWPIIGLTAFLLIGSLPAVFTVRTHRSRRLRRNG